MENKDEYIFDESYVGYYKKGYLYKFGRISKWWSPSNETSIVLSNSARPSVGLSISSYQPIVFKDNFLKYLGQLNFDIFINKLDDDRYIPNALFFGNRISIIPNNALQVSLFRIAQFAGDGRGVDSKDVINILIGNDNQLNDPSNQIAGLDLIYKNNNYKFYGQIAGEDESNFIPIKHFYLIGVEKAINDSSDIIFEYLNIDKDGKDKVYNHHIYKSGYRYHGKPIGAAIDSSSESYSLIFRKFLSDQSILKIKYLDVRLNQSNNQLLSPKTSFKGADFIFQYNFNKKFDFKFIYLYRDILRYNSSFNENDLMFSLTYVF